MKTLSITTAEPNASASQDAGGPRRQRAWYESMLRFARHQPLGALGAVVIVSMAVLAILAPILAPHDPYLVDSSNLLKPPGDGHLLGTDQFGRDLLSRLMWGARTSMLVSFLAVGLGTLVGAATGLVSGYFGGRTDMVIQRIIDSLMAFPALVLALALVAALGPGTGSVIIAIGLVSIPTTARVIRSAALSSLQTAYVEAARSLGASDLRILVRHVLPNCFAPATIVATSRIGLAILAEASLSFLGVGVPPPTPSWGGMLSGDAQTYIQMAPWLAVFPGAAIALTVFGANLLGDSMRDLLDPKMRGR